MPDTYQTDAAGEDARPGRASSTPRRGSIFNDPVVRVLGSVAVLLVVLYLSTIIGALLMGILDPAEPRTRGERDAAYYEMLTRQSPKDTSIWKSYVIALIETKQYLKAQDVIDRAGKAVNQDGTQDFLQAQAQLYYAQKEYDKAIKTADQVRTKLEAWYDAAAKEPGSPEAKGLEINENYWQALLVKAESLDALGKQKDAIKVLDEYLKEKETAADVFVRRGDLKAKTGDKTGAEKDYRSALTYIPDDPAALEGLKKIGAK